MLFQEIQVDEKMIHYYSIWSDIHDTVPAASPIGFLLGLDPQLLSGREGKENYN